MRRKKLFEVEECAYTVSGKLVLAARTEKEFLDFKEGDFIILEKPDRTEIETQIDSASKFKVNKTFIETILINGFKREDIPLGTVVFLDISE